MLLQCPTIRHACCAVLLSPSDGVRCTHCESHRHTLRSLACRRVRSTVDKSDTSSHVNYRFLSTPEKEQRLRQMHSELRLISAKKERLEAKLRRMIQHESVCVDSDTHTDLQAIVRANDSDILRRYPHDSFQYLFWKQQQEAGQVKDSRCMRWHPLFIKWCLYLRYISARAYETLRSSGCIYLPSQ